MRHNDSVKSDDAAVGVGMRTVRTVYSQCAPDAYAQMHASHPLSVTVVAHCNQVLYASFGGG